MKKANVYNTYDRDFPRDLKDIIHNYFVIIGENHNDMYHRFDFDEKEFGRNAEYFPTKEQFIALNEYFEKCGAYVDADMVIIYHGW